MIYTPTSFCQNEKWIENKKLSENKEMSKDFLERVTKTDWNLSDFQKSEKLRLPEEIN